MVRIRKLRSMFNSLSVLYVKLNVMRNDLNALPFVEVPQPRQTDIVYGQERSRGLGG